MGISLKKWVSFILFWTTVLDLGLCADKNLTLVEDDDDSVIVEARSISAKNSRAGRQIQQISPGSWFQAFGEGSSCITTNGEVGTCTKFRSCYPDKDINYLFRQNWESTNPWLLEDQETCNFFDDEGEQTAGVCCINAGNADVGLNPDREDSAEDSAEIPEIPEIPGIPELPTGTSSYEDEYQPQAPVENDVAYDPFNDQNVDTGNADNEASQSGEEFEESGEQYQFNWPSQAAFAPPQSAQWPPPLPTHAPGISQWPPQAPTHPPDHHYPTHPPHPSLPTHPPIMVTTARPPYRPTQRPTQRPMYPTYPPTMRPTARPPMENMLPIGRCGAKNGVSLDQERIVGGQNSSPHEWPWVVVLFNKGKQFCGGSLIDNVHILTAAHCVARMTSWDVAGLTAHLGDHNIRTSFEVQHVERKIKRLVRHKGFDFSTLHNDVAVLTLDQPVTFSREIRPICLPYSSQRKSFTGQIATVAGWGSLRENGPQPSVLQKVNIPVWANTECARKYGRAAPGGIIESMVCAGQAARDSCSGDSGGPLMINEGGHWTQVGIVSWGIGCGKGQYPGVYTRITAFIPWITKNLK